MKRLIHCIAAGSWVLVSGLHVSAQEMTPLHHAMQEGDPVTEGLFLAFVLFSFLALGSALTGDLRRGPRRRTLLSAALIAVISLGFNSAGHALTTEEQALHDATARGDLAEMRRLIREGVNVNAKDHLGRTPLHIAASESFRFQGAELLKKNGADADARDNQGQTPLHYAAKASCGQHCYTLSRVRFYGNINAQDAQGRPPPLHHAGDGGAANQLLHGGANVYTLDKQGRTPYQAVKGAGKNGAASVILDYMNSLPKNLRKASWGHGGDGSRFDRLISNGAGRHVNEPDQDGNTPLHYAVEYDIIPDRRRIIETLLDLGANVNLKNNDGLTPQQYGRYSTVQVILQYMANLKEEFWDAVSWNRTGEVERLLANGVDVNLKNEWGQTVLHIAAINGYATLAEIMLEAGAAVDVETRVGRTALYLAAVNGQAAVAKILRDADADPAVLNVKDAVGNTALHLAATHDRSDSVTALLVGGADPDVKNDQGQTALLIATDKGRSAIALLEAGADPDVIDTSGNTALHLAANHGHGAVVTALLEAGADPDVKNALNRTALHLAANQGHGAAVTALLDGGADPDVIDAIGQTALHYAALNKRTAIAIALLVGGADPDVKSTSINTALQGNTALHFAATSGDSAIVTALLDAGADPDVENATGRTALHLAAEEGYLAVSEILLVYYGDGTLVGLQDKKGNTALHFAAQKGHLALVELLVGWWPDALDRGNGAQIDPDNPPDRERSIQNKAGKTPRDLAQENGHTEVAKVLDGLTALERKSRLHRAIANADDPDQVEAMLNEGASVGARNTSANTPLHMAALQKQTDVAEFLLKKGASPNARNAQGDTPLHYAALVGDADMAVILLEAGADIDIKNTHQETASMLAQAAGHDDLAQCLSFGPWLSNTACTAVVSVSGGGSVTEGDTAVFTVSVNSAPTADLVVSLEVEETHGSGAALIALAGPQQLTIPAGQASATYSHATYDDQEDLGGGSVSARLVAGDGYTVSSAQGSATATVAVADNDATAVQPLPSPAPQSCVSADLHDKVRQYHQEARKAEQKARWAAVLQAFGDAMGVTAMTAAEAQGYHDRGPVWRQKWAGVPEAIRCASGLGGIGGNDGHAADLAEARRIVDAYVCTDESDQAAAFAGLQEASRIYPELQADHDVPALWDGSTPFVVDISSTFANAGDLLDVVADEAERIRQVLGYEIFVAGEVLDLDDLETDDLVDLGTARYLIPPEPHIDVRCCWDEGDEFAAMAFPWMRMILLEEDDFQSRHIVVHELYHLLGFTHPDESPGVVMSDSLMYGPGTDAFGASFPTQPSPLDLAKLACIYD